MEKNFEKDREIIFKMKKFIFFIREEETNKSVRTYD